jgi:hypothetical protein
MSLPCMQQSYIQWEVRIYMNIILLSNNDSYHMLVDVPLRVLIQYISNGIFWITTLYLSSYQCSLKLTTPRISITCIWN